MPDPTRPRASLRTAVVWEVLKDALDRRVKATGRISWTSSTPEAAAATSRCPWPASVTVSPSSTPARTRCSRWTPGRRGRGRRPCRGSAGRRPRPLRRRRARWLRRRAVPRGPGVRGRPRRRRAQRGGRAAPRGRSQPPRRRAWAAPCSPAPSPGHFKEAKQALDDPDGRWGEGNPVPTVSPPISSPRSLRGRGSARRRRARRTGSRGPGPRRPRGHRAGCRGSPSEARGGGRRTPPRSTPWPRSFMCSVRQGADGASPPCCAPDQGRGGRSEYATGHPIGRSAPYDRGSPSGMTGRLLGNARLGADRGAMAGSGWRIGAEGRLTGAIPCLS